MDLNSWQLLERRWDAWAPGKTLPRPHSSWRPTTLGGSPARNCWSEAESGCETGFLSQKLRVPNTL
jgi:hypothetical protein